MIPAGFLDYSSWILLYIGPEEGSTLAFSCRIELTFYSCMFE